MEIQKKCIKCKITKLLTEFYKHPDMPDGTVNKCKECNKKENKLNWHSKRKEKLLYDQNRHRYSIQRIFNHRYAGIGVRCRGVGKICKVTGMSYLSKQEWNDWCYESYNYEKFIEIYKNWVDSGFTHKLSPSIDRINNNLGYTKDNLQWLTQSNNSSKGNRDTKTGIKKKLYTP